MCLEPCTHLGACALPSFGLAKAHRSQAGNNVPCLSIVDRGLPARGPISMHSERWMHLQCCSLMVTQHMRQMHLPFPCVWKHCAWNFPVSAHAQNKRGGQTTGQGEVDSLGEQGNNCICLLRQAGSCRTLLCLGYDGCGIAAGARRSGCSPCDMLLLLPQAREQQQRPYAPKIKALNIRHR